VAAHIQKIQHDILLISAHCFETHAVMHPLKFPAMPLILDDPAFWWVLKTLLFKASWR